MDKEAVLRLLRNEEPVWTQDPKQLWPCEHCAHLRPSVIEDYFCTARGKIFSLPLMAKCELFKETKST